MPTLSYSDYYEKVLGGWIGKCIGGTVGAQVEGTKELMDFTLETAFPAVIPPNDDLDLQVLWLEVILEKGVFITSADLADAWMERCWYPFNEYGNFKRNYAKGITPPMSGAFDNAFFETGMGCPIRAEIWGFICPGNPALAADYAARDGCLDHTAQSVGAEQMWSAIVADAFFEGDIDKLIRRHMRFLPADSPVDACVRSICDSFEQDTDWQTARIRMLIAHGHPEACDSPVNTGLTVMSLLYGGGDFGKTMLMALNAGYDTDCTCATAGAVLGQVMGAARIPPQWKDPIGDTFVTGIDLRRTDLSLQKLTEDTLAAGLAVAKVLNKQLTLETVPKSVGPLPSSVRPAARVRMDVDYVGLPSIAWGETKRLRLRLSNETDQFVRGHLRFDLPNGWAMETPDAVVALPPGKGKTVDFTMTVPKSVSEIAQANRITARLVDENDAGVAVETFGLSGAAPWHGMGVFFDTYNTAENSVCPWRREGKWANPSDTGAWQHHFTNLNKPYIVEGEFDYDATSARMKELLGERALFMAHEMEVPLERQLGLKGEMAAYLLLNVVSPEDREAHLIIGNTDGLRLWLNGELVAHADEFVWWTPNNITPRVRLRKGPNRVVVKLVRRAETLRFSFGLRQVAGDKPVNCADWYTDFAYRVEPVFLEHAP